jgi:hypothetical protein
MIHISVPADVLNVRHLQVPDLHTFVCVCVCARARHAIVSSRYYIKFTGERNWSTYGFIVSRPRNKHSVLRAKKFVFVHLQLLDNKRVTRKVKRVGYEEI